LKNKDKIRNHLFEGLETLKSRIDEFEKLSVQNPTVRNKPYHHEEIYHSLIKETNDIVYSLDTEGVINYISPQIVRYGFSPIEVISNHFQDFILPEDREKVISDFQKSITTGEGCTTQFRIKDKAGDIHWIEENGKVQYDKTGRIIGVKGILHDITEHKEIE